VMHQQHVGTMAQRCLQAWQLRINHAYDLIDLLTPFNLETLWAIIPDSADLQIVV